MRINPVTAIVASALVFGFALAHAEKHEDAPTTPQQTVPAPKAVPSVAVAQKATQQPSGAWYIGWQFARKSVCIDSSIQGAPLAEVAGMFSGAAKGGLSVRVGGAAGACKAQGVPESQRVTFVSMSARGQAVYGACAVTDPGPVIYTNGDLLRVQVEVWVSAYRTTPCGNYASGEWVDVFAHEFGHAVGLSHAQPAATSIMRDGHTLDYGDRTRLYSIYSYRKA